MAAKVLRHSPDRVVRCSWVYPRSTRGGSRAYGGGYCAGGVPTWYCRETYHRPQRREMRDVLNDARRDYNANGETDIEPINRQARNEAHWSWW